MGRKGDTLKHQLRTAAFAGLADNHTLRAYRRAIDAFAQWAKEQEAIRQLADVTRDVIQAYEQYLEARPEGYTASTIHAKLAPICKAAGVSMREIRKPKRTAARIVRGRSETKTGRGIGLQRTWMIGHICCEEKTRPKPRRWACRRNTTGLR